jgi:DNA-binding GntR family transcriptional regulator
MACLAFFEAFSDDPTANLGRIAKSTLRAQVVEQLRTAILAGDIPPGAPLVETALSERFDVSRGPLREALRQLIEEGLVVTVPYTGTHVAPLSVDDVREIYSLRTALEGFAFEQVWERRDVRFRAELLRRNDVLMAAVDADDDRACIAAELDFHSFVYEASGHRLLQRAWHGLRGRMQLYWAAHHRAHRRRGPRRDSHDSYIGAALGDDVAAMRLEIADHMRRGAEQTELFLRGAPDVSRKPNRKARGGDHT